MYNDLPKELLEDITKILESNELGLDIAPDDVNKRQLSQGTAQALGEEDKDLEKEKEKDASEKDSKEDEDSDKEEPEDKKKLKGSSSEELASGEEPNGSGDSGVSEEDGALADKSDEELVNDWNLLTDVSRNIEEDDYKPTDKLEALKAEIDKRQLIKDGCQDGKLIKKKADVTEDVVLIATDNDGEYQIKGSTSNEVLGRIVTDVYGTIVTDTAGNAFEGIPKVSRDMSLADIKKALDAKFLKESVDLDNMKSTLEKLSDDELIVLWNKLTFTREAVSDDVEYDKSQLTLIGEILTDRDIVRGGIEYGKFINHLNIEKV